MAAVVQSKMHRPCIIKLMFALHMKKKYNYQKMHPHKSISLFNVTKQNPPKTSRQDKEKCIK